MVRKKWGGVGWGGVGVGWGGVVGRGGGGQTRETKAGSSRTEVNITPRVGTAPARASRPGSLAGRLSRHLSSCTPNGTHNASCTAPWPASPSVQGDKPCCSESRPGPSSETKPWTRKAGGNTPAVGPPNTECAAHRGPEGGLSSTPAGQQQEGVRGGGGQGDTTCRVHSVRGGVCGGGGGVGVGGCARAWMLGSGWAAQATQPLTDARRSPIPRPAPPPLPRDTPTNSHPHPSPPHGPC
jgi:hypothetical protein